ncbi:MAG: type II secretion system F family protein [Candidatus Coatesbacteria bacterium]|nr:type II secretion system F family protein [Candidatus Coatesbacteria bacterium]
MPVFSYKARDASGRETEGVLEAENSGVLVERLGELGYVVTKVSKARGKDGKKRKAKTVKVKRRDLITFTIHLGTVLSAGVPLLTGLQDLTRETEKPGFKKVIQDITNQVENGAMLADAMSVHPSVFGQLYVSMVRAGETTGRVDEVLERLVPYLEWQEELKGQVREALAYPAVVMTVISGVIVFLFVFPIPRFAAIFQKYDMKLPLPTRIVIGISDFMIDYGFYSLGVIIVLFLVAREFVKRTKGGRKIWDATKLKMPLFGTLIRKVALSRFAHTLSALYRAGVEITECLRIVEQVIGNVVLGRVIREAHDRIRAGGSMPEALAESGEFPSLVLRMVAIGDETGELDMTLEKVSLYYDKEVPYTIRRIFAIAEPLMIVSMGAIVGTVAMSVFMPLYGMIAFVKK